MFEERPLFGFGPGTYQFTYIPFQEKSLENRLTVRNPDSPPQGSGGSAHFGNPASTQREWHRVSAGIS